MNEKEIWKDIPQFEGIYQISNLGKVRSLDRVLTEITGITRKRKGSTISPGNNGAGYLFVNLWKNNKQHRFYVHRLVGKLYCNSYTNDCVINHLDGIKRNNAWYNLECTTASNNMKHSYANNLHKSGENHPNARLLNSDKEDIIVLLKSGKYSQLDIANKFNVSQALISKINIANMVTIRPKHDIDND